jgi:hypothetical protein
MQAAVVLHRHQEKNILWCNQYGSSYQAKRSRLTVARTVTRACSVLVILLRTGMSNRGCRCCPSSKTASVTMPIPPFADNNGEMSRMRPQRKVFYLVSASTSYMNALCVPHAETQPRIRDSRRHLTEPPHCISPQTSLRVKAAFYCCLLSRTLTQRHKRTTSTSPYAGGEGRGQVKSGLRTR